MLITSKYNPQIKSLYRLARQRRFREKEGKFILEGSHLVEEALRFKCPLETIICTPTWKNRPEGQKLLKEAREKGVGLLEVTETVFSSLADTKNPQGVMAVAKRQKSKLSYLLEKGPSLLVLIDGVQDPGNLGTIIRSADAAAAEGIILLKGTVDLYNPKVLRATMGSLFHLPVIDEAELKEVLEFLAATGLQLVVGDPRAPATLNEVNLNLPTVLAVGNEASGPSDQLFTRADRVVRIPMPGRAESLNVAVAASIMLYEAVRQRGFQG